MDTWKIRLDVGSIPAFRRSELSDLALDIAKDCFSRPEAEARYQLWLKGRGKEG